jgi:hypothetical protein
MAIAGRLKGHLQPVDVASLAAAIDAVGEDWMTGLSAGEARCAKTECAPRSITEAFVSRAVGPDRASGGNLREGRGLDL